MGMAAFYEMLRHRRVRICRFEPRARTARAGPSRQGAAPQERALAGLKIERVAGDLLDANLWREMEGCEWCFHVAASYHLWLRNYKSMYEANVTGTRNVLEAAGRTGCQRIVYTSTVGCIGLPRIENTVVIPAT